MQNDKLRISVTLLKSFRSSKLKTHLICIFTCTLAHSLTQSLIHKIKKSNHLVITENGRIFSFICLYQQLMMVTNGVECSNLRCVFFFSFSNSKYFRFCNTSNGILLFLLFFSLVVLMDSVLFIIIHIVFYDLFSILYTKHY